ncbi:hypothetical protein ACHWQZ_G015770 [Mnemiopsis leidyi]
MDAKDFVQSILNLSQQASNLACLIREDPQLNERLTASKSDRINGEADFKTLADVLIQCTFSHGLRRKFPGFKINVRGEEDGSFPAQNGKQVKLEITDDAQNTRKLLSQVLKDDSVVEKLSGAVHRNMEVHDDFLNKISGLQLPEELNVWIDPIDSTKSYIKGGESLESVTVLVGVHHAGIPIIGVMTYPFSKQQIWGVCYGNTCVTNVPKPLGNSPIKTVYTSTLETDERRDKLRSQGYHVETPAGAGFKLGGVILGAASFYLVSRRSTYQWDTCGPHAILRALGGDVVLQSRPDTPLSYNDSVDPNEGFVAFLDKQGALKLLSALK